VGSIEDVQKLAATIKADFPKLDFLMNNAGIFVHRNLAKSADLEELTTEIDINLNGTIRTTSALMELLVANKGTILNVSSGLAFVPKASAPIYCAAKAALHSYTTSLRFQLQEAGVKVIELMPPVVRTELSASVPDGNGVTSITTAELVQLTTAALKAGSIEIRPGQANQLHWMSRLAPGFINGQLFNGSKSLIPKA
jgi:uncharacterized oxidoreductase